jgi:hypothetical protein
MMGKYVYESHMGGLYTSEYPLPFDYLYCEQCGDSDWELGYFESRAKVRKMMKEKDYTNKYIKEFLDENFPKDGDGNG